MGKIHAFANENNDSYGDTSMEVINAESRPAKEHALIKEFLGLIDNAVGEEVPRLTDIEDASFMKFWKHLFIYRYLKDVDDFEVVLFGSEVVAFYGMEATGKRLSDIGLGPAYRSVYEANMRVINGEHRVFSSGTLFWQEREHISWHHVKMPIIRHGDEIEVLSCIAYDQEG